MKRWSKIIIALVIGISLLVPAFGQAYPRKAITVICPWAPGGGTDTILRALCQEVEKGIGQTLTVTNNTGGGGAVGHSAIMQAAPDGYTLGMITFELNSLPPQKLIPFDYTAYDPLMRINADCAALTVKADAPWKDLKEFIQYAKDNPGKITIGNSGPGSVWHIAAGLMAEKTGVNVVNVPFDGAAPAVTALVGGHKQRRARQRRVHGPPPRLIRGQRRRRERLGDVQRAAPREPGRHIQRGAGNGNVVGLVADLRCGLKRQRRRIQRQQAIRTVRNIEG